MRKIIYILAARLQDREIAGTHNDAKPRSLETPKPRVQSFCNLILTTYLNLEFLNYKFSEYGKSRPKTAFFLIVPISIIQLLLRQQRHGLC